MPSDGAMRRCPRPWSERREQVLHRADGRGRVRRVPEPRANIRSAGVRRLRPRRRDARRTPGPRAERRVRAPSTRADSLFARSASARSRERSTVSSRTSEHAPSCSKTRSSASSTRRVRRASKRASGFVARRLRDRSPPGRARSSAPRPRARTRAPPPPHQCSPMPTSANAYRRTVRWYDTDSVSFAGAWRSTLAGTSASS